MRFLQLLKGDLRFCQRYGIILVYVIFTLFYAMVIHLVPQDYKRQVLILLIYTDPAAMGLFFMGSVVLLEKSQRIQCSIAVSPVSIKEYIWSKLISMMLLGLLASVAIYLLSGFTADLRALLCIGLSSILFSCCGLIVASKAERLNLFIIESVPFEMAICIPAIVYLFGGCVSPLWQVHPGVMAMKLLMNKASMGGDVLGCLVIILWAVIAWFVCRKTVRSMFEQLGGGQL